MTNRPKNIGTAAETAVVRAARLHGFPNADRLTLTGNKDRGDVGLCPGVILEVKGGAAAKDASDYQIDMWIAETLRERVHAGAAHGYLVTQRRGIGVPNAHRWNAWTTLADLARLQFPDAENPYAYVPLKMHLEHLLWLLRLNGYGNPLAEYL